jgi:ubiquinone/menaquinone biosynthesis C-methylase UbiE
VAGKSNNLSPEGDDNLEKFFDITSPPFDRANGMSASEYYKEHASSCSHRNAVARYASSKEIKSILDAMQSSLVLNESILAGKTLVDIGGGYGDLINAMTVSMPSIGECYCLDLPHVIDDAISTTTNNYNNNLVSGNMFDASTIPQCDYIITKHVLCDFSDEDVVRALQSFHTVLSSNKGDGGGKVVIMDAVLPNGQDLNGKWNAALSYDVLLMLTGRRGERSRVEWTNLAEKAGFVLEDVLSTSSVTVDLAILSPK